VEGSQDAVVTLHLPTVESWTVGDLAELPRELRYELHNGNLLIISPLTGWHRHVRRKLVDLFERAGKYADFEVSIINGPGDTRVADVAIFYGTQQDKDADLAHYPPDRISTVVEVVSPRSKAKDGDPQWYAERGIPACWLAERVRDDVWNAMITMFELVVAKDSNRVGYVETARPLSAS
jgi:Uma2 family endonuclease